MMNDYKCSRSSSGFHIAVDAVTLGMGVRNGRRGLRGRRSPTQRQRRTATSVTVRHLVVMSVVAVSVSVVVSMSIVVSVSVVVCVHHHVRVRWSSCLHPSLWPRPLACPCPSLSSLASWVRGKWKGLTITMTNNDAVVRRLVAMSLTATWHLVVSPCLW